MFNYQNEKINDDFKIEKLLEEVIICFEKYGSIDNIKFDVDNNIEQLNLTISLDYGNK